MSRTATKPAAAKAAPAAGNPAADALAAAAAYSVQLIALDDIDVSGNPRTVFDDAETAELAATILEVGLLQPITVEDTGQPTAGGTHAYRLVYGGRRVAAYRLNGQEYIPAHVRPAGEPALTAATRLVENIQRSDLSPLDEAHALAELTTAHGLKQADVARLIGRNQGHVSKRLALLRLSAKGQAMVVAGTISLEAATDIAKLPDSVQGSVLTSVQGGASPEVAVRQARDKVALLKERSALIKALEKAGTPVIDRATDRGPIPEDAHRFHGDPAEWAADPGRLAEVRTSPDTWRGGDERWLVRYTTTEQPDGPGGAADLGGGQAAAAGSGPSVLGQPADNRITAAESAQVDSQAAKFRAEQEARQARLAELRDYVRTLINGKISDTWSAFLVRLALVFAIAGDPDDADGCPADVSSAGEALQLPGDPDRDLEGYETMSAVLGLLEPATTGPAGGTLLRLALGARLLNAIRYMTRGYGIGDGRHAILISEALVFLQSQGLELNAEEQARAGRRAHEMLSLCVEYDMVQDYELDSDPQQPIDERPAEDRIGDGTVYTGGAEGLTDADLAVLEAAAGERPDEATGEPDPDGFDGPVEALRPDHRAEAAKPTRAEIEAMKRPALIAAAAEHGVETTPRMTALQLKGALLKALVDADPLDDIS